MSFRDFSFHRSTDFEHVKAECRAVRGSVGISDTSSFAKYEITGPGAESWLSRMLANRIPRIGRMALTPMLNPRGKLIGDFTLARASADRFFLFGSGVAENYHMRWFEKHLPADGSVAIRALGLDLVGLTIAGPVARAVLAKLTDDDVAPGAFRFLDFRPSMEVGMAPAMVGRVSFTGDLGYEIWVSNPGSVPCPDPLPCSPGRRDMAASRGKAAA